MAELERRYTLKQAVQHFFPEGPFTVSSLRTEIRKGRLVVERIAGKMVVTESAIGGMMQLCRESGSNHASTSGNVQAGAPYGSSSGLDLKKAQDAAKATLKALKENSLGSSLRNTSHRKPAATSNVHRLLTS